MTSEETNYGGHKEALNAVLYPPGIMVGIMVLFVGINAAFGMEYDRKAVLAAATLATHEAAVVGITQVIDEGGCRYLVKSWGSVGGISHMGDCPNPIHKEDLLKLARAVGKRQAEMKSRMNELESVMGSFKVVFQATMHDLESTRRENEQLRKRLDDEAG